MEPGQCIETYVMVEGTQQHSRSSFEWIPVTLINGYQEGKTVLITSGIHGGEYEGIHAATELARELSPEKICGQLAIIHP